MELQMELETGMKMQSLSCCSSSEIHNCVIVPRLLCKLRSRECERMLGTFQD